MNSYTTRIGKIKVTVSSVQFCKKFTGIIKNGKNHHKGPEARSHEAFVFYGGPKGSVLLYGIKYVQICNVCRRHHLFYSMENIVANREIKLILNRVQTLRILETSFFGS